MTLRLDEAALARAAARHSLLLPRTPHRGRSGDVRAHSVGASMEVHDFRNYQPGDDLRQLDWNAVARTGELVLRVRKDEVSPRVEVLLDASASMALTDEKAARTAELALLFLTLAEQDRLEPRLLATAERPLHASGRTARERIRQLTFGAKDELFAALRRAPPLRPCGLRIVLSDFLFESPLDALVARLARDAAGLVLVQVLDREDVEPPAIEGARLVDSETAEALEQLFAPDVLERYKSRLAAHQALLRGAAQRAGASLVTVVADRPVDVLAAELLGPVLSVAA